MDARTWHQKTIVEYRNDKSVAWNTAKKFAFTNMLNKFKVHHLGETGFDLKRASDLLNALWASTNVEELFERYVQDILASKQGLK